MAEIQQKKHRFNQEDDDNCIAEWRRLLGIFKSVAEADKVPKDYKEILLDLKKQAMNNPFLTGHQASAITARVDNYLSGQYGISKAGVTFKGA